VNNYKNYSLWNNSMHNLNLLVKPTHRCNFNCYYCYDKQFNVQEDMSLDTVERLARLAKESTRRVSWTWHGGEPLMMPVEFYAAAKVILDNYGVQDIFMQSNGSLLTEAWSQQLKEWNWKCAFSFDGISNDSSRGHSKEVINAIATYKEITGSASVIKIVTPQNVTTLSQDYMFVKPFVSAFDFNRVFCTQTVESLSGDYIDTYISEYCKLLDIWLNDAHPLRIRNFDSYIGFLLGKQEYLCGYTGKCIYNFLAVNPIGDIYPCDCWYPEDFCYGNIHSISSLDMVYKTPAAKQLVSLIKARKMHCSACEIFDFSSGGCTARAIVSTGGSLPELSECIIRKREFYHLFNIIKDVRPETILNPNLRYLLYKVGYRSLSFLRKGLSDV